MCESLLIVLNSYEVHQYEELVLNTVACATNLLFYDTPQRSLIADNNVRLRLLAKVSPMLVQTFNEEITVESLRIMGNLTRHEGICKELASLHVPDVLFLLIEHSNMNIVYFTLGCLTNIASSTKYIIYTENTFAVFSGLLQDLALMEPTLSI